VNDLFSICLILPAALGSGNYSASNRNESEAEQIMVLGSRAQPVLRADKLNLINNHNNINN
jgi:hypothetical protein